MMRPIAVTHRACQLCAALVCSVLIGCGSTEEGLPGPMDSKAGVVNAPYSYRISHPPVCNYYQSHIRCDIPVFNHTDREVRFTQVRRSCTCQEARVEPRPIQPGETVILHMTADIRMRTGSQKFVCYLDEPNGTVWSYEVDAEIYERASFSPPGIVMFGKVAQGGKLVKHAEYRVCGKDISELPDNVIFKVAGGASAESKEVSLVAGTPQIKQQGEGVVVKIIPLTIHLTAGGEAGPQEVRLSAEFGDGEQRHETVVSVGWDIEPTLRATPSHLFWRLQRQADGATQTGGDSRQVILSRGDGRSFVVRAITGVPPGFDCNCDDASFPTPSKTIVVRPKASITRLPSWGAILVETDGGPGQTVRINFAAVEVNDR